MKFDPIVSMFERVTDVENPQFANVSDIVEWIRLGEDVQYEIETLRAMPEAEYKQAKKDRLPAITFGGKFSYRANKGLVEASGLMTLDFDHVKNMDELRDKLSNDPYIYTFFLSPSGRGMKALVRIPTVQDDAQYKDYYYSFMERYNALDSSGKDISRACFVSHDPNISINYTCKVWDVRYSEKEPPMKINSAKKVDVDYKLLSKICNVIRNAEEGERNIKIYNASMLAGGYIANGKLDYDTTMAVLEAEARKIAPDEMAQNPKTIVSGLKNGMARPLEELKEEIEDTVETVEDRLGKIYYTILDVQNELDELYENGLQKGEKTMFKSMNDHYTVKLGATTYVYGAPYSGKSQLWFELLIQLSDLHGWKHAIFSPETGNVPEVYAELISMKAREPFYNDYGNRMNHMTYQHAKDWVHKHFVVIDGGDQMMTVIDFYEVVDIIEHVYGIKIHTTTVDPFNDMTHNFNEFNGRQDLYLESILTYVRQNSRKNHRHNCIVTHVQDQQIMYDKDLRIHYYPQPTYRQIAGGQAWSRKGMAMISVWRPPEGFQDEHGIPVEPNESWVHIQKAKPKGIGKTGMVRLRYNAKEGRYYE